MSDVIRYFLTGDCHARISAILPDATEADFQWLQQITAADGLLREDGTPHPAFVGWVQAILERRRGGPDSVEAAVPPVGPVPGSAGAMIGGVV